MKCYRKPVKETSLKWTNFLYLKHFCTSFVSFYFLFAATWVLSEDAPIVTGGREGDNINFNCSMPEHSEEAADLKWSVNDKEVRKLVCHYTDCSFILSSFSFSVKINHMSILLRNLTKSHCQAKSEIARSMNLRFHCNTCII